LEATAREITEIAMTAAREHSSSRRCKIALALQGGGSHGAFTWGVLDRLLEEPTFDIIGVTGTSAGAVNTVLLADGLVRGGPEKARQGLRGFWEAIGRMPGVGSLLWPMSGSMAAKIRIEHMPAYQAWDMVTRNLSPYELNPFDFNPLRELLERLVDFDRLRRQDDIQAVLCATNVRSGKRRSFSNADLTVDAVLASACLPELFPAIEIGGEAYWDGGYTGNPAIVPLIRQLPGCDLVIVRIDPVQRRDLPRSMRDIRDRVTEISFNSASDTELAALGMLLTFMDDGLLPRERFGRFRFHAIEASALLEGLPLSSKRNNYAPFLDYLFDNGRGTANAWLVTHRDAIGERSTFDPRISLQREVWSGRPPNVESAAVADVKVRAS
jgi:NTE family protein